LGVVILLEASSMCSRLHVQSSSGETLGSPDQKMSTSRRSSLLTTLFEVWFGHWWFVLVVGDDLWSSIYEDA
jgi:hypothetical protein